MLKKGRFSVTLQMLRESVRQRSGLTTAGAVSGASGNTNGGSASLGTTTMPRVIVFLALPEGMPEPESRVKFIQTSIPGVCRSSVVYILICFIFGL